jgi:hypothetical protein
MKHLIACLAIASPLIGLSSGVFAASTGTPGQPSQSCEDSGIGVPTNRPGNAFSSNGATFNDSTTPGTSTLHYAGNPDTASLAHAGSINAVSQYDVACFQQSQKGQLSQVP